MPTRTSAKCLHNGANGNSCWHMQSGSVPLQFWSRTSRLESGALVCLIFQPSQQMIFATIEQEPKKMKMDQHRWVSLLCGIYICTL